MSSAYFKTEGIVLKKMPYAEADFLVRVLTKDFGKMDVLAKGARKSSSKLNPHLDILNYIRMQFVKTAPPSDGASERIPTITDAEINSRFDDWFSSAESISLAGRIIQTIDAVILPGAKDEKLFQMTLDFFKLPNFNEENAVKFLRDLFCHEGHGDSLPPEHGEKIIKLWPNLKKEGIS